MQKIITEIDSIVKEVTDLMTSVYAEFQQNNSNLTADYSQGAAMVVFRLGLDYFVAARDVLHKGSVISGGALVRIAVENLADLFFIYDKPDKYPKAYVESMEDFRKIMLNLANKDSKELAKSRELKQANKWTNASIEDRIKKSGNSTVNIYDLLSYFGHPNPGSLTYITNTKLKEGQLNLLKQANCMLALTLMRVVLNHSDIKSVGVGQLSSVSTKLGLKLTSE